MTTTTCAFYERGTQVDQRLADEEYGPKADHEGLSEEDGAADVDPHFDFNGEHDGVLEEGVIQVQDEIYIRSFSHQRLHLWIWNNSIEMQKFLRCLKFCFSIPWGHSLGS